MLYAYINAIRCGTHDINVVSLPPQSFRIQFSVRYIYSKDEFRKDSLTNYFNRREICKVPLIRGILGGWLCIYSVSVPSNIYYIETIS